MSLSATPIKSLLSKPPLRQGEALETEVKHHHPAHPPGRKDINLLIFRADNIQGSHYFLHSDSGGWQDPGRPRGGLKVPGDAGGLRD